jgi:hypothetical protein
MAGPLLSDRVNQRAPSGASVMDPGVESTPGTRVLLSGNGPGGMGRSEMITGVPRCWPTADVPMFTASPTMKAPIMAWAPATISRATRVVG